MLKAPYVYIQGHFLPHDQAVISIEDRGFRFGDGVFETIRLHQKVPYQWALHLARLQAGLGTLKIPVNLSGLWGLCRELIERNNAEEGFLRVAVTRGRGSKGYLPALRPPAAGTLVIETFPAVERQAEPVDLWLSGVEKISSKALPVQMKTMQGLNSILARMEAEEQGCFEALLLGERKQLCEGSSSNIFWYRDNTLFTPSESSGLLPGTTRAAVMRLAPCKVREGIFLLKELRQAEEVFVTNTAWQVLPVRSLKPLTLQWSSFTFSHLLQQRLEDDIAHYASQFSYS